MTTTGGGGGDRLSDLSDDLLRRILFFVPYKEAASTSVLSRRWGSLWRSSGAVNLAVKVYDYQRSRAYGHQIHGRSYTYKEADEAFFSNKEAFIGAAESALDAAESPITRLTLRVDSDDDGSAVNTFLCRGRDWQTKADVVGDLLSHTAARHVEELRVAIAARCYLYGPGCRVVSLPSSETLCVLDLTRCDLMLSSSSSSSSFRLPRLATLRLCCGDVEDLQALLDAAPELTTVQLECLLFLPPPRPPFYEDDDSDTASEADPELDTASEAQAPVLRLNFHAVTTLVLASCDMKLPDGSKDRHGKSSWAIEIDAPMLQSFTYKGLMRRFILRPPAAEVAAPGVARVDLHFMPDYGEERDESESFWQFLQNFTDARTLKLKVENDLKNIAATGKERRAGLLCAFPSVERLELEGTHRPRSKTAAVAIANLLHCCPVVGEILLKLSSGPPLHRRRKRTQTPQDFLQNKDQLDYSKSIDRFVRRRKPKTAAAMISMEDSTFCGRYSYDGVPGIPGLRGRSFACLQHTLRRVGLQFRLDNNSIVSSCLGVRLIKFFAGHASVLEEICVDTGNRRLYGHLNFNAVTQMALAYIPVSDTASIQHENLAECSSEFSRIPGASDLARSTVGFTVLPLPRQRRMDFEFF